jgi:kinesin family protein 6/9
VTTNAQNGNGTCFHFDEILSPQMDQRQTYDATASDVVESVMNGYNGTILAYGQTGAGKTFTMSGGKQNFDQRGIYARSISSIFRHIQRDPQHEYTVRVSFVEIYNEILYDLLDFTTADDNQIPQQGQVHSHKELIVQENDKGMTFIKGLAKPRVENEEQSLDLLFQGETNRTIAEHTLNASSTRSHCIFTIYIEKKASSSNGSEEDDATLLIVSSKLNLVDLAVSNESVLVTFYYIF